MKQPVAKQVQPPRRGSAIARNHRERASEQVGPSRDCGAESVASGVEAFLRVRRAVVAV